MSAAAPDLQSLAAVFLFSPKTMSELTEPERRGEFTLERLQELRPEVIAEIVKLRGQWVGRLRIARALKVSVNTIAAVDAQFADPIESRRLKRIQLWEEAADQLVAQIAADPDKIPWSGKAFAAVSIKEKAELMAGRATSRVEHPEAIDIEQQWRDFIEGKIVAGSEKRLEPSHVREVTSPMGLDGSKNLALPAGSPVSDGSADGRRGDFEAAESDLPSPNLSSDLTSDDTSFATNKISSGTIERAEAADDPGAGAGRGGDAGIPEGADAKFHKPLRKFSDSEPNSTAPGPPMP